MAVKRHKSAPTALEAINAQPAQTRGRRVFGRNLSGAEYWASPPEVGSEARAAVTEVAPTGSFMAGNRRSFFGSIVVPAFAAGISVDIVAPGGRTGAHPAYCAVAAFGHKSTRSL
jgi:hypothetical protein